MKDKLYDQQIEHLERDLRRYRDAYHHYVMDIGGHNKYSNKILKKIGELEKELWGLTDQ